MPSIGLKLAYPALKFDLPLWLTEPPDGSGRLFLVEQNGRILILPKERDGTQTKVFLDLTDRKPHELYEEGLLCLAFHPQFRTNGKFYIFYSQQSPKRTVLSEIQVSKTDPDKADLSTERVVLEIPKPYGQHNGGTLLFGPDGYLYVSVGDGGGNFDPNNLAQSLHYLHGKILRIDVDSRAGKLGYGIPKDNPFVAKGDKGNPLPSPFDTEGLRPEIWAYGFRNVWRMSFDRETGRLWAGDVGQDQWEEVDLVVKGGNYGWSLREGIHRIKERDFPEHGLLIDPVIEYAHNAALAPQGKFPNHAIGNCVTGGYVYHGKKIPELRGIYLYADYARGIIWGMRYENGQVIDNEVLVKENPVRTITSFGEDQTGELYVTSFNGNLYQIVEGVK